jgi:DNA-binding transcriptional MerR regulator
MTVVRHDAQSIPIEVDRGIYDANRAAAFAGVPMRNLHRWATTGLLVPSVSPERVRLWSWADLLALRIIDRLRHGDEERRRSSTRRIPQALNMLREHGVGIDQLRDTLLVDHDGRLYVRINGSTC